MALSKNYLIYFILGMAMLMSLGTTEVAAAVPVTVAVQTSIQTTYGATMVAVPVYLTNAGFDTIGGFRLTFTSDIPLMIDFNKTVDRTPPSLSADFPSFSTSVDYDSLETAGDVLTVVGIADPASYILPQESGTLFTLFLNIADSCELISDTNNTPIKVAPFISQVSDNHGNLIPSDSTDADTLILNNGSVEVPGKLILGDVNGSCNGVAGCQPDLADLIHMVNYIFKKPGDWTLCPPPAADVNCSNTDSEPTLADVITLVNYIFKKPGFEQLCTP